jgi:starvation-inducible outer membrane lipoprotein
MKKYSKEVLLTALLTGLIAALSFLLSSCSGLQSQVRGKSDVYRSDTIHTIFYYDKPVRSTINVDY